MAENKKIPDQMLPLLKSVGDTIDQVLNGSEPRQYGYVLVIAPLGEPPVQAEVIYNVTHETVRLVLVEGLARIDGRLMTEKSA